MNNVYNIYRKFIHQMLIDNNLEYDSNIRLDIFDGLRIYSYKNKVIGYSLFTRQISKLTGYKILTCKKNFEDFKIMLDKLNLIV